MKETLLLLVCLLCTCVLAHAQPLAGSSNEEQLLIAADSARVTNNYIVALENYEEAYEKNDDEALLPHIGRMQYELRDVAAAIRVYTRLFRRRELGDTTFHEARFFFGKSLKMDGQYDEAVTQLETYLEHAPDGPHAPFAKLEIEGAKLYRDAPKETSEVALELLGRNVNSSWSEYSPVLSADGNTLYFATVKATEPVVLGGSKDNDDSYLRIFMSTQEEKRGEVSWGKAEQLGREVNRPGVHTANPALSADGRRLYYNRILMDGNVPGEAKIYMSDVDDNGWKSGNPVAGLNSDNYLALQPAVGELFGGEVLFFVSDMDGGFGGYDIYYAPYQGEGRYGSPVNLGETVNTIGDDMSPFYFDGTLYYSTNGRPTMGGFDLFYTAWNGSSWSTPENMGPGFNSTVDDQSLSVYGDGLVGFMTSNREGGRSVKSKTCCDDVYGFRVAALYANLVVGLFSDERQPLTNGTIELQPLVNAAPAGPGTQKTRDDGNRFDFGLELETLYQVIASHPGYYPDTVEITTLGLEESKNFEQVFFLKKDPSWKDPNATPEVVLDTIITEEVVALENILYDFDKADIREDAEPDLVYLAKLMNEQPNMVIELGSHTDYRGDNRYNQQLSKRRADSARKWLIVNAGIDGPRIKTQGYGETQPVVVSERLAERTGFLQAGDVLTEAFIQALPDEQQQERANELNRRTEFKILSGAENLIIDRNVIERELEGPNRKSNIGARTQVQGRQTTQRDTIGPFSSLYGQADTDGLPFFTFDRRTVDIGAFKQGQKKTFEYRFTNASDVPAKIMLIQACDCTTVEHDNSKTYAPGESGTLIVTFDSSEKDADETITIDLFLEQEDKLGRPINEMVEYSFRMLK